jgi:serine/threonine protein kinase
MPTLKFSPDSEHFQDIKVVPEENDRRQNEDEDDLLCPGSEIRSGRQTQVSMGCPTPDRVRKLWSNNPRKSNIPDSRFRSYCQDLSKPLLQATSHHPGILPLLTCEYVHHHNETKLLIDQPLVRGHTLERYLQSMNKKWLSLSSSQKLLQRQTMNAVFYQAISLLDTLWRHKLYHNDLHIGNIILARKSHSSASEMIPFGELGKASVATHPFLVTLIDYGYMSHGFALDHNYQEAKTLSPPWMDLCQLVGSMDFEPWFPHLVQAKKLNPFRIIRKLTRFICQTRLSLGISRQDALVRPRLTIKKWNALVTECAGRMKTDIFQGRKVKLY